MKKRVLKVVTAWALVLCMTIPTILSVQAQEGEDIVSEAIDKGTFVVQHHTLIDDYRDGEFGAPDAPEGYSDYLFAGWYADENCETAKDSSCVNGEAYAKYVHKDVLGVKAQVLSGTYFSTETSDIRFVSTVDSLDYLEVGFSIVMYGNTTPYTTDTVYKQLYAVGSANVVLEEYTPDLFHETSEYFFACTVTGVTNDVFDYGIQVAPYWITLDGTTVQADSVTKSVSNGYMYKAMDADATEAGTIALTEGYELQGGSLGGKYYYLVSTNGTDTIVEQLAPNAEGAGWNTTPNKTGTLTIIGTNDITYNGTDNKIVMVSGSSVSYVDRSDLTVLDGSASIESVESIKYNKNLDKYVAMLADGTLKVLDSAFEATGVATTVPTDFAGYTARSVTADDSYIYQAFTQETEGVLSNKIAVYNWAGEYVTSILVALTEHAITTIDIANNTMYAACATTNGNIIYNVDILKTFDIVYNLNGGTTTSPTGYTKNSGDISISEPTKGGYEFLGWSKETVSLSDVTWKDGLASETNGNITTSTWPDAKHTESLYLKDGLKHTLLGDKLPDLRWRLFQTSDLTKAETETAKTSFGTASFTMSEDVAYPYAVLSLKTTEDVALEKLYIKSEFVKPLTLNYTVDETETTEVLDNFTKGFINTGDAWSVRYNHGTYPKAVYSDEIELKGGVTYTLTNTLGSGIRWRLISADGAVSNVSNNGTYEPTEDCTVRVMLLDGRSEYKDAMIQSGSTGDRTYTATWVRNSFKVQYNANGGKGTMEDSIHEFAINSQLSANTFTKEDYGFTGWNTEADGSGTDYADVATVKNLTTDESITLYAQWSPLYTISYEYGEDAIAPEVENPTNYTIKSENFTLNEPTRTGYDFAGWTETISLSDVWTSGDIDENTGEHKDHATRYYSDLIYLQKDRSYTTNASGTFRWRVFNLDGTFSESKGVAAYTPSESCYVRVMLAYATDEDARNSIIITSNASSITVDKGTTGNRTYVANWVVPTYNYTVAYNSNVDDGTVVGTMENSSHVTGTASALKANAFTREGYAFTGWNTAADGTGTTYGDGATVMDLATEANAVVTLYAQWTNENVFTITYDLDGGALVDGGINPESYAKTTESFTLTEPTKDGYTFAGWEETISLANNWTSGNLTNTGSVGVNSTRYYSDFIYLQKDRSYTFNGYTGTLRWRMYSTDYVIDSTNYGLFAYAWDANHYVRFLLASATTEDERNSMTLTSSASTITVNKGTTGNITYKATWIANE